MDEAWPEVHSRLYGVLDQTTPGQILESPIVVAAFSVYGPHISIHPCAWHCMTPYALSTGNGAGASNDLGQPLKVDHPAERRRRRPVLIIHNVIWPLVKFS